MKDRSYRFTLYAEREGQTRQYITGAETKEAAQFAVESMEEAGTWPEGYEAVLVRNSDNKRWMYVDGWEPL